MKIKVLVGVLIFLIVINLATIGSYVYLKITNEPNRHMPLMPLVEGPERPLPPDRPELKLNKGQREKLINLLRSFREKTIGLRQQMRKLEDDTFVLLQKDTVSPKQVDANLQKISEIKLEISKEAVNKLIDAKKFLSPEQQKHFYNALMQIRPEFSQRAPDQFNRERHNRKFNKELNNK